MNSALFASQNRLLRRLLNPYSPLLLRRIYAGSQPKPPKRNDEVNEATVTQAIEFLQKTPPQNWAFSQSLQTLISSSPNLIPRITRRLPSYSEALNFFNFIQSNSQLQDSRWISYAFQAVLETARKKSNLGENLSNLYRLSKEKKVPITRDAAAILIRGFADAKMVEKSVLVYDEIDLSLKNTHLRNVFIGILLESGRVNDAQKVFDEMLQPESEAKPNKVTGDTFFYFLWRKEQEEWLINVDEIVDLVLRFGKFGVFPKKIMLDPLFSTLCKEGKFVKAWWLYHGLVKLHAPLDSSSYFFLISTELEKKGEDEMKVVFMVMKDKDNGFYLNSLKTFLKAYKTCAY